MMQPLEAKEIAEMDAAATKGDRFWCRIPILGWGIADMLWVERTRPIVEKIERQLKKRPEPESAVRGASAAKIALACSVCRIIADEMSWPNAYFVPEDPAAAIF